MSVILQRGLWDERFTWFIWYRKQAIPCLRGNKESVDFVHKELQCLQITGDGERSKAEHLSIFSQPIFLVPGWTQKKRKGKTNSKGLEWLVML